MSVVAASVSNETVVKAQDSGLWSAAERSLEEECFPACKLFILRGVRQGDSAEPAHVGLLNCELVSVPDDCALESLPERIQKLDPSATLHITDEAYVTSLSQLKDLVYNRDETTLVHHVKVQRLGLSYPERLLDKTFQKIREADVRDWQSGAAAAAGLAIGAGFVMWASSGELQPMIAAAAITTGGAFLSWANTMITLASVHRCLTNLALPSHPPSLR